MAVVQCVALARDFIDGHFLHQIAQQVIGKAGGVQGLEGEIGLLRLPPCASSSGFDSEAVL